MAKYLTKKQLGAQRYLFHLTVWRDTIHNAVEGTVAGVSGSGPNCVHSLELQRNGCHGSAELLPFPHFI